MKLNDILEYSRALAPFETAEEWDNVGLLVGSEDTEIDRVLLALDVTPAVVREAHEKSAALIISHHPVIFRPLSAICADSAEYLLIKYGIAALCLHTNLDRAENGVNTALGKALGLQDTELFPEQFLLVGETCREYTAAEFATHIKESLNAPSVRFTEGKVSKIAISSGGGGEGVELALEHGCDAFVTGELKHHQYLYAAEHGIAAFDAGHFSTEDVVIPQLKAMLEQRFPDGEWLISESSRCPYKAV